MKRFCLILSVFALMVGISCNQTRQTKHKPATKVSAQLPNIHARPVKADNGSYARQFAYIKNLQQQNGQWICTADYIVFYMGSGAVDVARKRGDAAVDTAANGKLTYFVYNDYYIVNDDKQLRKLLIAPTVAIKLVDFSSNLVTVRKGSLNELINMKNRDAYPFIFSISKGIITSITQQYVP